MPRTHPAALPPAELLKSCSETRTRRSGPGGQHRNKTETAVVLVHAPTGISAEASERRSQAENRREALHRLRLRLALEHREPAGMHVSHTWRSRVRGRQLVVSSAHEDFPALVAEALDRLYAATFETSLVAEQLGVTGTQLVRLFKKSTAAWVALNRCRKSLGLPELR
ncbi:MAG: peptide chain release factor family protein [Planctomycetaceae bacterium]